MTIPEQYRSLKETAGLVERLDRGRIAVGGSDRADYLQGLLTNDIVALTEGKGCYAAYLTPQGRMLADADVLSLGDRLLLDVHAGVKGMLVERFKDLVFTEDVDVSDWSETWVGYNVTGPSSTQFVSTAIDRISDSSHLSKIRSLDDHDCCLVPLGRASAVVARTDSFGGWGLDLWVERQSAQEVRSALLDAGCVLVNQSAAEVVRIEHGRPAFPIDMSTDTIPLEASIEDRAISFTKGCYVGQEVIVRILHRGRGRVSKKLTGLTMTDLVVASPRPTPGAPLWHGDRQVGHLTSVGFSPSAGVVIALGYVARVVEPGTVLEVDVKSARVPAVVTSLPFAAAARH